MKELLSHQKYYPLQEYLKSSNKNEIKLNISDIEKIIDAKLPLWEYTHHEKFLG